MERAVEFGDNDRTKGKLFVPEGASDFPAVLFFHGTGSTMRNYLPIVNALLEQGIGSLAFDSRIYGENTRDKGDSDDGNDDFREAAEAMRLLRDTPGVDPKRIGVYGSSRGGFVAACLVGKNPDVSALALRAPANFVSEWLSLSVEGSESMTAISAFKGKLLVIECGDDKIISHETTQAYHDRAVAAAERKLHVIVGAPHVFGIAGPFYEELKREVVDWFKGTLVDGYK